MIHSFCLFKPDCVGRQLVEHCLKMITDQGLEIVMQDRKTLSLAEARIFYLQHRTKPYYHDLCQHITSGDCHGVIVSGLHAIDRLNALVGVKEPQLNLPGIIRNTGYDLTNNIMHSSDNLDQFFREAVIFFSKERIMSLF